MTLWENIKADPIKLQKHNENSKKNAIKRYHEDPVYKEYMKNKAKLRKEKLKEEKKNIIN